MATERLWAKYVDYPNRNVVELWNTPFWAKGVSFLDWVDVVYDDETGNLDFKSVIKRSGRSTYRIIVYDKAAEAFGPRWQSLSDLGCSYESANKSGYTLYAIDVPQASDIWQVYECLRAGQQAENWIFEEAHVGHAV